jgi:CRP-like cAMP-binding protein
MSLEQDLRNLSNVPLFASLEMEARRLIAFSAETRVLRAGDVLFSKSEHSDGGYVLSSGSIAVTSGDKDGRPDRIVRPVALLGEMALISDVERTFTATAREPSEVLRVTRALFHRVLKEYPRSASRLRDVIAQRLADLARDLDAARSSNFDERG